MRTQRWPYIRCANGDGEIRDRSKDEFESISLARQSAELNAVKRELTKHFPKINHAPAKSRRGVGAEGDEGDEENSAAKPAK